MELSASLQANQLLSMKTETVTGCASCLRQSRKDSRSCFSSCCLVVLRVHGGLQAPSDELRNLLQAAQSPPRHRQAVLQIPLPSLNLLLLIRRQQKWVLQSRSSRSRYYPRFRPFYNYSSARKGRILLGVDEPVVKSASASAALARNSSRSRS